MELKLPMNSAAFIQCTRSNRTFMELKFSFYPMFAERPGSNRTFMELKSYIFELWLNQKVVLIAPLWN